jgi:hypothetical protein
MSINSIENLSNELFYEIFDYLDGYHVYQAFSNLNNHFQQFLNSSFLLFKIKYCCSKPEDVFMNNWKQMMCFNRQQIYSIDLWMSSSTHEFLSSSIIIDSSLNHLQSLVLHALTPTPIEHLDIVHHCTFNELSAILSYTPQLCHLKFTHELDDD